MRKRSQDTKDGKRGQGARFGSKALSYIAAFTLVMSMCPGAAALAFANDQLTAGSTDLEAQPLSAQDDGDVPAGETIVTSDLHEMKSGVYHVTSDVTINPDRTGNGIRIAKGAKVHLIIDKGKTLTVKGADATGNGVGHAAILLPEGSTLVVMGSGTLIATGGKGGNGADGGAAENSYVWIRSPSSTGRGGHGGSGGGGAGAGIGTDGGAGGAGGEGGERVHNQGLTGTNIYGYDGKPGAWGSAAEAAGTVLVTGGATVDAKGGAFGAKGGSGGKRGCYFEAGQKFGFNTSVGTSGGGGGGAAGGAADGIGSGGSGGGGGGGGASGSFDGEFAFLIKADLDDLWGHGGSGGTSAWGGSSGARGDEGASNGGDDTNASKKYAKAGGAGGSCAAPKAVAFYTYKGSDSANPTVTCTSGHGAPRAATVLNSVGAFTSLGGHDGVVSGGTFPYDGEPHGATVKDSNKVNIQSDGAGALSAQAGGDEAGEEWSDSGTIEIDGVLYTYSTEYYDAKGVKLPSAPMRPGQYAAVVKFSWEDPVTLEPKSGSWVEQITITKVPVEKPAPTELVFECANWETGEGAEQDAFPGLDETYYEFVPGTANGGTSLRSAKDVGDYQACFKLKDPEIYEWADGTEGGEAWVPWSIKLSPFDPNDVTYWGPAYNNSTTKVDYTGEPVWVRPWYTYTKDTDGEFPGWYTHWGSDGRPTTDRLSACVVYLQGEDDYEGLVGYHTNADGTLEKVTGAQVYAWANGVDVDGTHVDVESGDKVWYRTGEDGSLVVLAVQEAEPEGAEGCVVARDYAYATHLGVKDVGTYQAYALFDEGTGFETTALAEATVEVVAPGDTPASGDDTPASDDSAATKASSAKAASAKSSSAKTGDFSPLAIAGIALAALLAAGGIALAARRRG